MFADSIVGRRKFVFVPVIPLVSAAGIRFPKKKEDRHHRKRLNPPASLIEAVPAIGSARPE